MTPVEEADVRPEQALHALAEIRERGLNDQVDVVTHKAVREQPPSIHLDNALQDHEEDLAVPVISEDVVAVVAAGKHVVRGTGFFASRLAWHTQ